jgi:hypothetical protein
MRRAILAAALLASACGCPEGDANVYFLRIGTSAEGLAPFRGVAGAEWDPEDPDFVRAYVPPGAVPRGEMLEVWSGDVRIDVRGVRTSGVTVSNGCFRGDAIDYDLGSLPNGVYLLVHRGGTGPSGVAGPTEWMDFRGEPALVVFAVIDRERADAGAESDAM